MAAGGGGRVFGWREAGDLSEWRPATRGVKSRDASAVKSLLREVWELSKGGAGVAAGRWGGGETGGAKFPAPG